ncbi:hypothetical protein TcasGA2_TC011235 [Tribolium castaneum]|uniref:Uncharacterized protein n=1 Tax=Tribolium castaneum TaxID=7070 RepID=D6X3G9_TRICA|nr:hypothetical protein TcasGA2_TC011235 [Tribolium castaneum]
MEYVNMILQVGQKVASECQQPTVLQLVNKSRCDIIDATMSSMDKFDWLMAGPLFDREHISSNSSQERNASLNKMATHCPFEMTLIFSDGTVDKFRMHQKFPFDGCSGFQHFIGPHTITFSSSENKVIITVEDK